MSAVALSPEPAGDGRNGVLWGGALAVALAAHAALGAYLLLRPPAPATTGEPLPAVIIDMAPPASAPAEPAAAASPSEFVPTSAAPEPGLEKAPDVPDPVVEPPPTTSTPVAPAPIVADATPPPALDLAVPEIPPPAVVPPNPTVILRAPPKRAEAPKPAPKPNPDKKVADAKPPRPVQAEIRGERRVERRPPSQASGAPTRDAERSASTGASAASSAAWRSQLVAYLQRSLRYPPGSGSPGAASVSFSVNRQGRVLSASLSRSSGNPILDSAAMAIFRGAVPPPPADYSGSLTFNIPIRFTQR